MRDPFQTLSNLPQQTGLRLVLLLTSLPMPLSVKEKRDIEIEIGFLEPLVNKAPDFVEALQLLADDYTKVGRTLDGLRLDEMLAELCPDDALVHYNLACSHSLTGRLSEAAKNLLRAFELGYRDFQWLAKDQDLESLRNAPEFQIVAQKMAELQNHPYS